MPINLNRQDVSTGEVVFSWNIDEYQKHDRSRRWYIVAVLIGGLLLVYSLISGNYLFTLIVVLYGIILFLQDTQQPMEVFFAITEAGVVVGEKYYPFKEITSYWIVYNPPEVKNIYFAVFVNIRGEIGTFWRGCWGLGWWGCLGTNFGQIYNGWYRTIDIVGNQIKISGRI